ncbi:MAG: polysaccharide biosynthesis protein [Candidatus Acidiferrales bacterium]
MKAGENILVTGAGGCIGSALARTLAKSKARRVILLDHAEHELHELECALGDVEGCIPYTAIIGDIGDAALLAEVFEEYRPQTIYHAAAFKHVAMMERNPLAAVHNNVFGTLTLARTASQFNARQLVMISTDKAVNPCGVMGVSKRLAELILLRFGNGSTRMKAVRLGNVLGSRGSVAPLFSGQIARGGPVTVTHPEVSRFFVTLSEAVEIVVATANEDGAGIFVSQVGEPITIVALARQLIKAAGFTPENEIRIVFTELSPGEKLNEEMVSERETIEPACDTRLRRIKSAQINEGAFDVQVKDLARIVERRDLPALVDALVRVVPEYEPSELLLNRKKPLVRAATK